MRESREPRVCPHCAKPLQPVRYGVAFGPLAASIIDAIERSGRDGVAIDDLFRTTYNGRNGSTKQSLQTYIRAINRALVPSGIVIANHRRTYRIMSRRRP